MTAVILYRDRDTSRAFAPEAVPDALREGWYVLTEAGHPVSPTPEPASEDAPPPSVSRRKTGPYKRRPT
jgi:hypothetical protein